MKTAFGEEREKGEKTRVGYIQGDAGFESEMRGRRRGRANAGITDAGNHRRGIRVAKTADAEKSRL